MIDAWLFAARDKIRAAGFGYDAQTCAVMEDGHPPPACGAFFVAVHAKETRSVAENSLDEYFNFAVTLTMRVDCPLDRVGDQLFAQKLKRQRGPGGSPSFTARVEQLRSLLHMAWNVMADANALLLAWTPDEPTVYGFCEPARYRGMDMPRLVGGEWFAAVPDSTDIGLVSELRFADLRRLQALGVFV